MGVPVYFVYEGDVGNGVNPARPTLDTVGGAAFVNDAEFPPDPTTDPTAEMENQAERLLVAYGKLSPLAVIYVKFSAGTPAIFSFLAGSTILQSTDFAVTDHGDGDTEITCSATLLPPPSFCLPFTQMTGDFRPSGRLNGTGNGIRIETRSSSGALADADFVVLWW